VYRRGIFAPDSNALLLTWIDMGWVPRCKEELFSSSSATDSEAMLANRRPQVLAKSVMVHSPVCIRRDSSTNLPYKLYRRRDRRIE
jgi:hypothetical protein